MDADERETETDESASLDRAVDEGLVRPAEPGSRIGEPLRIPTGRTAMELLADDRGD